jgi:hypothetical protein
MDSDDPEQRIRDLENQLADARRGFRENVPTGDEAGPTPAPRMPAAPGNTPPAPATVNLPDFDLLHRRLNRRRRSRWLVLVVPVFALTAILLFHPHRGGKQSVPSMSWSGTKPTADLSHAITVGPGGNLTAEPTGESLTFVCNQGDFTIGGKDNSVYVAGHCAYLIVKGSHNKVIVDNSDAIDIDGTGNQLIYHTGEPQISVGGSANTVRKG